MTGRFIAFLWMLIGLMMFAFFTSMVTTLLQSAKVDTVPLALTSIYNRITETSGGQDRLRVCTVQGVYEELLAAFKIPETQYTVRSNIFDCYREFIGSPDVSTSPPPPPPLGAAIRYKPENWQPMMQ